MGSGLGVGQELGDPHALVGPHSSCCGGREGDGTHLLEGEFRVQRAPAPRVRDGTGWLPSMSCTACKEASEELGLCPSSSLTYTLKNSGKILKRTATSYQPVGCPLRQGCLWVIRTRTVSDELCRAGLTLSTRRWVQVGAWAVAALLPSVSGDHAAISKAFLYALWGNKAREEGKRSLQAHA